jgi:hypothetical protein
VDRVKRERKPTGTMGSYSGIGGSDRRRPMAKVEHTTDNISPASTFSGKHVTTITTKNGDKFSARGHSKENSRAKAEEKYDTDRRGE